MVSVLAGWVLCCPTSRWQAAAAFDAFPRVGMFKGGACSMVATSANFSPTPIEQGAGTAFEQLVVSVLCYLLTVLSADPSPSLPLTCCQYQQRFGAGAVSFCARAVARLSNPCCVRTVEGGVAGQPVCGVHPGPSACFLACQMLQWPSHSFSVGFLKSFNVISVNGQELFELRSYVQANQGMPYAPMHLPLGRNEGVGDEVL